MNIKHPLIVLMCVILLELLACSQNITPALPSQVLLSSETPTMKPVLSTQISITPTHLPSSSCVTIIEQSFKNPPPHGKIVLSGLLHFSGAPLSAPSYILDLDSGEKILLPQQENKLLMDGSFSISPDRRWLAYAQENIGSEESFNETIHLVEASGDEYMAISTNLAPRTSSWLDNNQLLVESLRKNWTSNPDEAPAALFLLNPFTGESQELFNDYPGQWNGDTLFWRFNLSRVLYNSAFTRVIYPTFVEPNRVIRLINTQTNQILADIPTTDYGKYPTWSSDGKLMAFATQLKERADWDSYQDEIFTLTDDGKLLQLTNLSKGNNYSYITGLSWSAEDRFIAFLVNNADWKKGYRGVHLAIVDVHEGKMQEYCDVANSDGQVYIPEWENPMWSPDSKYLLVNFKDPNDDRYNLVVIVEVSTGKGYQIADNYRAIGWLK